MIRWCAYCQTYQGESPPYDDYGLTHGLCSECQARGILDDARAIEALKPLTAFHTRLREEARKGFHTSPEALLMEAERMGLRPVEMLLGLLQPILCEVAELWSCGKMPGPEGVYFSGLVNHFLEELAERHPNPSSGRVGSPFDVLILGAPGNHHSLGPRLVELVLRSEGVSALAVTPGVPVAEARALVEALHPPVLGISISAARQLPALRALEAALDLSPEGQAPRRVLGGLAVKRGLIRGPMPGWEITVDPRRLISRRRAQGAQVPSGEREEGG